MLLFKDTAAEAGFRTFYAIHKQKYDASVLLFTWPVMCGAIPHIDSCVIETFTLVMI